MTTPAPVFVLFYESAADIAHKAQALFPAHKVLLDEFTARGELLLVGAFDDRLGSMAVFRSPEGAQDFAARDPFVREGVVASWHVRQWNEILGVRA